MSETVTLFRPIGKMKGLTVFEVYRIDHINPFETKEDEPLGIYLRIKSQNEDNGIRFNIDNSGQNVEIKVQSFDDFSHFTQETYGKISRVDEQSELYLLVGSIVQEIYFAFSNYKEKNSESFFAIFGDIIGLQIVFEDGKILTFYNDGDEGKVSFDFPLTPTSSLFEDIVWKKQNYIIQSITNSGI